MNPIEVRFSGLAYSFSLESLKMCLIFCSHLLENQLRYTRTWMSLGCQRLLQSISETRARTETRHMTSNSPPLMHGDQIARGMPGLAYIIGNLSTDVFEPRTATGSRMFSFLALFCSLPWTAKLLFLCLRFDITNAMASKRSKEGKIQLPVDVRGSKTSVLKFPNEKHRRSRHFECRENTGTSWNK